MTATATQGRPATAGTETDLWAIWAEGYAATGEAGTAWQLNETPIKAASFDEAVLQYSQASDHRHLFVRKPDPSWTYWGCRLFDNEAAARRCVRGRYAAVVRAITELFRQTDGGTRFVGDAGAEWCRPTDLGLQHHPAKGNAMTQPHFDPTATPPEGSPAPPYTGAQHPYGGPPQHQAYPPAPQYGAQPPMQNLAYGYPQPKSKIAAGLFGIFLGGLGIHRFYLGYTKIGLLQLGLTLLVGFFTLGIGLFLAGLWGFIEGIMILAGSAHFRRDVHGVPLRD